MTVRADGVEQTGVGTHDRGECDELRVDIVLEIVGHLVNYKDRSNITDRKGRERRGSI